MPQQTSPSTENNFSQGFKTEYTTLNFPENSSTDSLNVFFSRIGDVYRRPGVNYETNFQLNTIDRTSKAVSTFVWQNAGGDGSTKVLVEQVGNTLYFYVITDATTAAPLSTKILASTVDISQYAVSSADATQECQYSSGNGYLFVYRPDVDPFYCTFVSGVPDTVTSAVITIQIRDFAGIPEDIADNFRPSTLSTDHNYNLINQGWSAANPYTAVITPSDFYNITVGHSTTFNITSETNTTSVTNGDTIQIAFKDGHVDEATIVGTVTAYVAGVSMTLTITANSSSKTSSDVDWTASATKTNTGSILTWQTTLGNYPSNADVWWSFKNSSGVFSPSTTVANIPLNNAPAAKGYIIMNAFNQQRDTLSSLAGITDITTTVRPRTGTWFQGRVWFTGVDASVAASGDMPYTTFTENIYFSQIITQTKQFGYCYQTNDPTSETFFDLLPTDGGVIVIQGSGSIYKLFPIQNGLLVFAANGIWFITGSTGIGFTANDYTITKISGIQNISSTSYVDVQGMPLFWNEEGIYGAINSPQGIQIQPLTLTTIQTFYQQIPLTSRKHVRGAYDPLNWEVRWIYRSTEETGTTDRYEFDSALVFNITTQSFSPWTFGTSGSSPKVNSIQYVQSPGGSTAPDPIIKYLVSKSGQFTFAEENDVTTYSDWTASGTAVDFTSYFVAGFKIRGKGQNKSQVNYIYIYVDNTVNGSYKYQGVWDFAINRNSNKFSALELKTISLDSANFSTAFNRHRIRGRGLVYQFKITSVSGQPFDILGWSVQDKVNTGL